jgi:hypothetical protein
VQDRAGHFDGLDGCDCCFGRPGKSERGRIAQVWNVLIRVVSLDAVEAPSAEGIVSESFSRFGDRLGGAWGWVPERMLAGDSVGGSAVAPVVRVERELTCVEPCERPACVPGVSIHGAPDEPLRSGALAEVALAAPSAG